jgi:transcriptional regulator CtsR
MIVYFLKSATCLALLLAFYHFILEKEKMHTFNRFYLLGSVLFSFLAPLYIIYIDVASVIAEPITGRSFYSFENTVTEESINYTKLFVGFYLFVSSIFLIRFGRNLFLIINKIGENTKVKYQKALLVLVDDKVLPHTFWNYIFINKNDYENQKIEQELYTHELTHVTQKHTLDVLILEVIQILFWINPFFILLKKAVQLNHEFIADETVIHQHKNTFQYQHLLVNKAAWKNEYYLASNLNYSLTKKRLLMMTTKSSSTKILLKKLAVIPLLTGLIFLFAERVEAKDSTPKNLETINEKGLKKDTEVKEIINEIGERYDINSYSELNKSYEIERNKKPHFIESSAERQNELNDLYSKLRSMYAKLSKESKLKSKSPVHPHEPYLKLMKNNKVYYKLRSEFTKEDELLIPPPPPNPNASKEQILKAEKAHKDWQKKNGNNIPPPPPPIKSIDHVVNMAKKGVETNKTEENITYYADHKLITKKEMELIQPDKIASVDVKKNKDGSGAVYITTKKVIDTNTKEENITYYIDNKRITKKEMELIPANKIESVDVKKDKDGSGSVYITSKKQ